MLARDALELGLPWLTFGAIDWLDRNLHLGMTAFEYGSGGSTVFMAPKVGALTSIEHDPTWFSRVRERAACVELVEGERGPIREGYGTTERGLTDLSFERYARAIDRFPERSLDLVLIDGPARHACVRHALPKITGGGYVLFDDASWPDFAPLLASVDERAAERRDFFGLSPDNVHGGRLYLKQTTVWRIR